MLHVSMLCHRSSSMRHGGRKRIKHESEREELMIPNPQMNRYITIIEIFLQLYSLHPTFNISSQLKFKLFHLKRNISCICIGMYRLSNVNDAIQRCRHDPIFTSLETVIIVCFRVFISHPLKLDALRKTCAGRYLIFSS